MTMQLNSILANSGLTSMKTSFNGSGSSFNVAWCAGTRPTSASGSVTAGNILVTFTGVQFGSASAGTITTSTSYNATAGNSGTATFGIIYQTGDDITTTATTTPRATFSIGTSGADLNLSPTNAISANAVETLASMTLTNTYT
jgi:hypothetical protein